MSEKISLMRISFIKNADNIRVWLLFEFGPYWSHYGMSIYVNSTMDLLKNSTFVGLDLLKFFQVPPKGTYM